MRRAARLAAIGLALSATACTEHLAAPGLCPTYCPSDSLAVRDTILRAAISRDTAYGRPYGYVNAASAPYLLADTVPGVRGSHPIFRTPPIGTRSLIGSETTTGAVIGVDSLYLFLTIPQRDTATHDLAVALYELPHDIDSTTTFAALTAPFSAPPVRAVNVDTLLAQPGHKDPASGDSIIVDSTSTRITLALRLDSADAPYSTADSGTLAFGVRVSAAANAHVEFASSELSALGPRVNWYVKYDSLGIVAHKLIPVSLTGGRGFDGFVFDPPPPPLNGTLVVGSVPAARSVLRVTLPRAIRDSATIVRATLELIPAALPQGLAADSFDLVAQAVLADFGAKSPLDALHVDTTRIYIAPTDTVRVEVTNILRFWASDTLIATTLVLRQAPEGADLAEIRFYPSSDPVRRPLLRVTYTPHFPFGRQ